MSRALFAGLFLLTVVGCALPPEQVPLKPLPENGMPLGFADLKVRARLQATAANEAFYDNKWSALEDAAKGLELTAQHLAKAADPPARHKDKLDVEAGDLGKEAAKLRQAAKEQDEKKANEAMQRLNLKVRQLCAED
jgi:hypothetical protein